MTFGEFLTAALAERNLSQSALARLAGIKQSLISSYVSGEKEPGFRAARVICGALGVPLADLEAAMGPVELGPGRATKGVKL
jgi:transcriptional regulator with XRE-family HTH domain